MATGLGLSWEGGSCSVGEVIGDDAGCFVWCEASE